MSLFPRAIRSDFGHFSPMFQLLDDYSNHLASRGGNSVGPSLASSMKSFQPRFDVKETKDNYELHGELPGVEQKNIAIEFTDANTLTIKGRTEHHREEGTRPAGFVEGDAEQGKLTEGEGESNGYHKPTVEDDSNMPGANPEASKETQMTTHVEQQNQPPKTNGSRYWVSERSVGSFSRTFAFPDRVDQDNVKASLKNGILSVVIPKAAAPVAKRINIE